ncbi:MAG TPA: hypothetical protein VGC87_02050 [Pyrinomonadaceae bacterium]|jgi:hypothetical protein
MTVQSKSCVPDSERTSRRRFAKSIAATLVAAPLAARLAGAQTPAKPTEPTAPQELSPTAEAYLSVARARFGDKLSPEQLEQIKKDLDGNVRTTERLRAVKLKNGDEPDFVFIP